MWLTTYRYIPSYILQAEAYPPFCCLTWIPPNMVAWNVDLSTRPRQQKGFQVINSLCNSCQLLFWVFTTTSPQ